MFKLQELVGTRDGRHGVRIMYQHHADRMYIPPGVAHAVTNLQPNFKIAADGSVAAHFPAYVEAVDSVLIPFFVHDDVRLALAQDYGEVSCRAVLGLLRQYF